MASRRRGVSPIIAVLLLILIAIAAGVMVYAFVAGWVGSATSSTTVAQGQLSVDYAFANATSENMTVYIRNVGGVNVNIDSIYVSEAGGGEVPWDFVNDTTGTIVYGNSYPKIDVNTLTIQPGSVVAIVIDFSTSGLNEGQLYTIKIVADDGTTYVFSVKAHD